ncbi:MAG TPA: hypothetical protein VM870_06105 [Pyrinomonadaceae bacterium]|jgi:hypothetical protein|nr:hypothetical protein [Pyrinomonadaceae bacterium]
MMSELNEKRWAVISERGVEQTRLSYAEAVELVARLASQKIRGLNVIGDEAAERLARTGEEDLNESPAPVAS